MLLYDIIDDMICLINDDDMLNLDDVDSEEI